MKQQAAENPVPPVKRSRRFRRRPKSLRDEFNRRSRKIVWLETHIWQAKRMYMVTKWGHRIAQKPCEKSIRATYRAVRDTCTVHDASYFVTLEVCPSDFHALRTALSGHLIPGLPKDFDGSREYRGCLFENAKACEGPIAPVSILRQGTGSATCWVRTHPAFCDTVATFLTTKGLDHERTKHVRFELTGPKSTAILQRVLHLTPDVGDTNRAIWESLSALQTSATLPGGVVLGLAAYDPRLTPTSKTEEHVDFARFEANIKALSEVMHYNCHY